jgi:hypothetical protein
MTLISSESTFCPLAVLPNPLSPAEGAKIYSPSPGGRRGWGVRANH